MKFDARSNTDQKRHDEFVEWLANETAQDLRKSVGQPERIKTAVFVYLHRGYEAHLDPDFIVDLLGVGPKSILNAAGYIGADEETVLDHFEILDPIVSKVYD